MKHVSNRFTLYICIASLLSLCEFLSARADSYTADLDNVFRSHRISNTRPTDCRKLGKQIKCLGKKIDQICNCNSAISFGSKEINRKGGFVISEPGHYCLKEDVVFNPSTSAFSPPNPATVQAAITIQASNVFLDLGSHTLSQADAGSVNQVPYCIGILVPDLVSVGGPLLESIYINGSGPAIIQDFSMFGIRIKANTFDIQMRDFTVKQCGTLVSLVPFASYTPHSSYDTTTLPFPNDAMQVGGIVIGETLFNGLGAQFFTENPAPSITGISAPRVEHLIMDSVSCLKNYGGGLLVAYTSNVAINNCHFDSTFVNQGPVAALGYTNPAFGGLFVGGGGNNTPDGVGVVNLLVTNTTFNQTQVIGDFTTDVISFGEPLAAGGAIIFDGMSGYWDACQFNGTSMTFASALTFTNFVIGAIVSGVIGYTFNNCSFNDIMSTSSCMGMHSSGTDLTQGSKGTVFRNCQASNIQQIGNMVTTQTGPANLNAIAGFYYVFGTNPTFESCVANDIISNGPMNTSSVLAGFLSKDTQEAGTTLSFKNAVFTDCSTHNCLTKNGGLAAGFFLRSGAFAGDPVSSTRSVDYENCISEGTMATIPTPWLASTSYSTGDLVISAGIIYESTQDLNIGNMPPNAAFWQVQNATGTIGIQGVGCGFCLLGANPVTNSYPWSLSNCKALNNKGITFDSTNNTYSAGFYLDSAQRASLFQCEALTNVYGFFLQQSDRCAIRECRADNNVDTVTGIGEGFTDIGTGTPAAPTQSTSVFENNTAYMNGSHASPAVGQNLNYNVFVNLAATKPLPTLQGIISATSYTLNDGPAFAGYSPNYNISNIN